jgi:hypothetical protein
MAHTLHNFAYHGPTDTTAQCLMNLTSTHARCASEGFNPGHDLGRSARAPQLLATGLRGGHAGFDALGNQRGLQLGHRPKNRKQRFPHAALCIDLVLEADKADTQMVELLQSV